MNVLMTADAVGGVWTYVVELSRALSSFGVRVTVALMGPRASAAQRAQLASTGAELHEGPYRLEWQDDPWSDVDRAGDWLLGLADDCRADLVHLNGYTHAGLPWGVPVVVVAHSCVRSWWRAVKRETVPSDWDEYTTRVAAGLASADAVVAPTDWMLRAVRDEYGCRAGSRTLVIPNGRDAERFARADKRPVVFASGRVWDEGKNIRALVDAAAHFEWPVHVAGERRAASTGDHARVKYLDRLPEDALRQELAHAAIFALPARYEPFGLGPLEAALARCALVLGDIPSLREVWGPAALYVDPDSPRAIAEAVNALAADDARREALARAARRRALTYTPTRMARAYADLYAELGAMELSCAS